MATLPSAQENKPFDIRPWLLEPRPHYLFLPVVLILVGTASAYYFTGIFSLGYALLALLGLTLCHMSVNIINDYYDFVSGVDLKVTRTPFNGGSGMLPAGRLRPNQVLWYGLICFILVVPIGIFFIVIHGWQLLPLLILGGICIIFYTSVILKIHFPEWSPGAGLGILPVLGAYFVQTGSYSIPAFFASIPSGILVLNLLLLNEFPDADADRIADKKTLPITMGKKGAAVVYSALTISVYLFIIGAVLAGRLPAYTLIALLTVPFAYKAIRGSFEYDQMNKIVPAMGNNVLVVLLTQALLGIGFVLGTIF